MKKSCYQFLKNLYHQQNYYSVLVDLTNNERVENKLDALLLNPQLVEAAQKKADDMAEKGYFAHVSPDGSKPWYWFEESGYEYTYAGENLAVDFSDSEEVKDAWMDSPLHRANILNGKYTEIGIATAKGKFNGKKTTFVVQMFGSPKTTFKIVDQISVSGEEIISTSTPTTSAITTQVLGAETSYVEFKSEEISTGTNTPVVVQQINVETPIEYASRSQELLASPGTLLKTTYGFLAVIILFALTLFIGIELKIRHPKNVAYGFLLLIIMGSLFWLYQYGLFSHIIVV